MFCYSRLFNSFKSKKRVLNINFRFPSPLIYLSLSKPLYWRLEKTKRWRRKKLMKSSTLWVSQKEKKSFSHIYFDILTIIKTFLTQLYASPQNSLHLALEQARCHHINANTLENLSRDLLLNTKRVRSRRHDNQICYSITRI